MRFGTNHFVNKYTAQLYYECTGLEVERKILSKEICIGKPKYDPNLEELIYLDDDTRYGLQTIERDKL